MLLHIPLSAHVCDSNAQENISSVYIRSANYSSLTALCTALRDRMNWMLASLLSLPPLCSTDHCDWLLAASPRFVQFCCCPASVVGSCREGDPSCSRQSGMWSVIWFTRHRFQTLAPFTMTKREPPLMIGLPVYSASFRRCCHFRGQCTCLNYVDVKCPPGQYLPVVVRMQRSRFSTQAKHIIHSTSGQWFYWCRLNFQLKKIKITSEVSLTKDGWRSSNFLSCLGTVIHVTLNVSLDLYVYLYTCTIERKENTSAALPLFTWQTSMVCVCIPVVHNQTSQDWYFCSAAHIVLWFRHTQKYPFCHFCATTLSLSYLNSIGKQHWMSFSWVCCSAQKDSTWYASQDEITTYWKKDLYWQCNDCPRHHFDVCAHITSRDNPIMTALAETSTSQRVHKIILNCSFQILHAISILPLVVALQCRKLFSGTPCIDFASLQK